MVTKVKIAYLIAAHTDFKQLIRLSLQLVKSGDVFIHIDKKVSQETYNSLLLRFKEENLLDKNVFFLKNRVSVSWAGFSQVLVQRILLGEALNSTNKNYSRFVFLSGLCYPIKESKYIINEFYKNSDQEYVCGINLTTKAKNNQNNQKLRFSGYHLFRDNTIMPKNIKRITMAIARRILWALKIRKSDTINNNGKREDIYFGGSWLGLTRQCAKYVYDNLSEKSCYCKYFRTSYACDELCIPTIVFNSIYSKNAYLLDIELGSIESPKIFSMLSPLHLLYYKDAIKVYDENDIDEILASDRLFVRKVTTEKSLGLIKILEKINGDNNKVDESNIR